MAIKPSLTIKVNDGFKVSEFATQVDCDFIYSKKVGEDFCLLLNNEIFGKVTDDNIEKQKEANMRIVIINNDTLMAEAFNISEEEIITGIMNMGSV